jgi:hypothetical protein
MIPNNILERRFTSVEVLPHNTIGAHKTPISCTNISSECMK